MSIETDSDDRSRADLYGFRCELVLRAFGYPRSHPSYVDAGVLEDNIVHARKLAQKAIERRVRTKRYGGKLLMNEEAKTLCVEALKLDVETDAGFHQFVEKMEKVVKLLDLKVAV